MRAFAPFVLLLALGACAGGDQPASDVLPGERSASASARQFVNGVGTPVHAVMKGVGCVVTTVVGIPLASVSQISGTPQDQGTQQDVYNTVGRTCGGSYELGGDSEPLPAAGQPAGE
jgi:hypothetical protein